MTIYTEATKQLSLYLEISKSDRSTASELETIYYDLDNYLGDLVEQVKINLAKNPNTPIELLIELCSFWIEDVAQNPALDLIFFEHPNFVNRVVAYYQKHLPAKLTSLQSSPRDRDFYPNWFLNAIID